MSFGTTEQKEGLRKKEQHNLVADFIKFMKLMEFWKLMTIDPHSITHHPSL
jgi:hypothetical protein